MHALSKNRFTFFLLCRWVGALKIHAIIPCAVPGREISKFPRNLTVFQKYSAKMPEFAPVKDVTRGSPPADHNPIDHTDLRIDASNAGSLLAKPRIRRVRHTMPQVADQGQLMWGKGELNLCGVGIPHAAAAHT